jgi:hypothetical protein
VPPAAEPSVHDGPPTTHEACAASGALPGGQAAQFDEPEGAYCDGGHGAHELAALAPVALRAVPEGHCVQEVAPSASL